MAEIERPDFHALRSLIEEWKSLYKMLVKDTISQGQYTSLLVEIKRVLKKLAYIS